MQTLHNKNQTIYTLPNGYPLRYALVFDSKGDNYSRFRRTGTDYQGFHKALTSSNKNQKPLLELDSAYQYPLIAADFDDLPEAYNSFDEFYEYLDYTYSSIGLVTRTPSGKCKVLFQCKLPDTKSLRDFDRLSTLESIIGSDVNYVDKRETALTKVYLTEEMFTSFKTWKCTIHPGILRENELQRLFDLYTYDNLMDYAEDLTEDQEDLQYKLDKLFTKTFPRMDDDTLYNMVIYFIRYARELLGGFPLNQKLMAQMLNTTQSNISKILAKMEKSGLINRNGSYCVGFQAKKHKVSGDLYIILSEYKKISVSIDIKAPIKDGQANDQYMMLTRHLVRSWGKEKTLNFLLDKDNERPLTKRRPFKYFETLVNCWTDKMQVL
jgi:DNA-binding MarR family transcriptional regulator